MFASIAREDGVSLQRTTLYRHSIVQAAARATCKKTHSSFGGLEKRKAQVKKGAAKGQAVVACPGGGSSP